MSALATVPSLFVVTLSGGSYDDLPSDSSVWCDLDARPNGEWLLLCSREQADNLEKGVGGNFDGEVVSVEAWDGSDFGDGNCGTVRSLDAGILDDAQALGTVGPLPAGWQIAAAQSESSGISHWASGADAENDDGAKAVASVRFSAEDPDNTATVVCA